jgi:hypothetical protein
MVAAVVGTPSGLSIVVTFVSTVLATSLRMLSLLGTWFVSYWSGKKVVMKLFYLWM